jgi:hypothetical protein
MQISFEITNDEEYLHLTCPHRTRDDIAARKVSAGKKAMLKGTKARSQRVKTMITR